MKLKLLCLVLALVVVAPAFAQNKLAKANYPEARKLYDEFEKTLNRAMLWEKSKHPERVAKLRAAEAHRDKVQKLWGDFAACTKAAHSHVDVVMTLNRFTFSGETGALVKTHDLLAAVREAEIFGNHRMACYFEVEELDVPTKK